MLSVSDGSRACEIVLVTSNISYGSVISGSQFVSRCCVSCSVAMNENNRGKFATYLGTFVTTFGHKHSGNNVEHQMNVGLPECQGRV